MAAAVTRGEAVTAETLSHRRGGRGRPGGSAVVLNGVQRSAYEWRAGDSKGVARVEVCISNEGKGLSPGDDEVFSNRRQV